MLKFGAFGDIISSLKQKLATNIVFKPFRIAYMYILFFTRYTCKSNRPKSTFSLTSRITNNNILGEIFTSYELLVSADRLLSQFDVITNTAGQIDFVVFRLDNYCVLFYLRLSLFHWKKSLLEAIVQFAINLI